VQEVVYARCDLLGVKAAPSFSGVVPAASTRPFLSS
jgi:hypothetical protein